MNRITKALILFATVSLVLNVRAIDSRYDTIVDRNIFRLTSPPPPPPPPTNNEALDRNIELSGIANIGGKKKAWFIVKAKGAKEPQYVNLGENERQEFLEVLKISEEDGEVKVLNAGNSMILSFKNNGNSAKPTLAAPQPPGAAPIAAANLPTPGSFNPAASGGGSYASPSRGNGSSVTVSGGNQSTPNQIGQMAENGLRTIPTRTLRLAPVAQQLQQQQQQEAPVDPQKQREMMEIQKAVFDAAGQPLPPLPPSPGGPLLPQ